MRGVKLYYKGYVLSYLKVPASIGNFTARVAAFDASLLAKIGGKSHQFGAADLLAAISKAKAFIDEMD